VVLIIYFRYYLCIVCILVRHPDDGCKRGRNMSVNSNI